MQHFARTLQWEDTPFSSSFQSLRSALLHPAAGFFHAFLIATVRRRTIHQRICTVSSGHIDNRSSLSRHSAYPSCRAFKQVFSDWLMVGILPVEGRGVDRRNVNQLDGVCINQRCYIDHIRRATSRVCTYSEYTQNGLDHENWVWDILRTVWSISLQMTSNDSLLTVNHFYSGYGAFHITHYRTS